MREVSEMSLVGDQSGGVGSRDLERAHPVYRDNTPQCLLFAPCENEGQCCQILQFIERSQLKT